VNPIAIVQARMTSSRLPGKILMKLGDETVLHYVIRRCQQSRRIVEVVLATTDERADDPVVEFAKSMGIRCYRGSRNDVLDRYVKTAVAVAADPVIRITSDCPFIEPTVIDQVVEAFETSGADFVYTSGFPRGTGDAELLTFAALQRSLEATRPEDDYYREHVITYPWRHPEQFSHRIVEAEQKFKEADYRLCIDEKDDLDAMSQIAEHFAPRFDFSLTEILAFLADHLEIAALNRHVAQKCV